MIQIGLLILNKKYEHIIGKISKIDEAKQSYSIFWHIVFASRVYGFLFGKIANG